MPWSWPTRCGDLRREGNLRWLPDGKGADRFRARQALAHTFLADLCQLGLPGIDWDWALCHMDADLRRNYGEDYLLRGLAEPITHTLDLALGYQCTAKVARYVGDNHLAAQFERLAGQWVNAFNPEDGLLLDSTYYIWQVNTRPGAARHAARIATQEGGGSRADGFLLRLRRRPVRSGRAGRTHGW